MQENRTAADRLRKCFMAAAANVEKNKELINELNVFPVPDGDTGTNVAMTLMSAAGEVNGAPDDTEAVLKAMSSGALKGARGNSGVIFSQLIRGLTKSLREADAIDADTLAAAFKRASDTAYKAVMKPKEGTILTVARCMAEKMNELLPLYRDDVYGLILKTIEYGDEILKKTPEMLPVLKEAGVVDSGGMALMVALKGIASVLTGREADVLSGVELPKAADAATAERHLSTDDIRFGYCTECIIVLKSEAEAEKVPALKTFLESIGDSIVCVEDDGVVKIHVHTNHPGEVFERCLELGELSRIKVDNLKEEQREVLAKSRKPLKEVAVVSVCAGGGLAEIFRLLGADYVVEGGQTMNPSIQDILDACMKAGAKKVIVLPNNKNIILASQQAEKNTEGRFEIITVPSKTVVQGITAMMNYDPEAPAEDTAAAMTESLSTVKSGEVTYSVRSTSIDGFTIEKDDIMGIGDSGLLAVGKDINDVTLQMIEKMVDKDTTLITVYAGEDITEEKAEELRNSLAGKFGQADIDIQRGDQPVYYYLVSVE